MKDGYYTFKLRGVDPSVSLVNNAVTEGVNLLTSQFHCKRENLERAIKQSN